MKVIEALKIEDLAAPSDDGKRVFGAFAARTAGDAETSFGIRRPDANGDDR